MYGLGWGMWGSYYCLEKCGNGEWGIEKMILLLRKKSPFLNRVWGFVSALLFGKHFMTFSVLSRGKKGNGSHWFEFSERQAQKEFLRVIVYSFCRYMCILLQKIERGKGEGKRKRKRKN